MSRNSQGRMRVPTMLTAALTLALLSGFVLAATVLSLPSYRPSLSPGCASLSPSLTGTNGDDVLQGTNGDDVVFGLGGDDTIRGRGGSDTLCGGTGDDLISSGGGRSPGPPPGDTIEGGAGSDTLIGSAEADAIIGGPGRDNLHGRDSGDSLAGDGYPNHTTTDRDSLEGEGGSDACVPDKKDDIMNAGRKRTRWPVESGRTMA